MTATATSTSPPPPDPAPRPRAADRPALAVFVVLVSGAAPLLLLDLARERWFVLDEWDFLVDRRIGSLDDLFRPHNEHWSTLPVIAYRAMYALVGLHHYWPYQAMIISLHLATVVLLRIVMRRAGVGPWTATVVASLLILFGAGQEDIVWAFQIGFVGSLAFGLVQLILADHDGGWARRDWLGLLAGAAALMCSGVGVAMVVIVGISTWCRRGWRASAGHVAPLMALYLIWWNAEGRPGATVPSGVGVPHIIGQVVHWDLSGIWGAFEAVGRSPVVAAALILVLVSGLALSWRPGGTNPVRGVGAPVLALLCGVPVFLTITGWGRWYFPTDSPTASRYLYLVAAMMLPAFAVAVDAIGRRWRFALPVALVVMVLGVPGNVGQFGNGQYVGASMVAHGQLILSIADSPLARQLPPNQVLLPRTDPRLTIGWLLAARAAGKVGGPGVVPPTIAAEAPLVLTFTQGAFAMALLNHCRTAESVRLDPPGHSLVHITGGTIAVDNRDATTGRRSAQIRFNTESIFGPNFSVRAPGLHLRIRSVVHGGKVTVCD